jgi:two-component system, NtrC family, nitrogen regulation sensor histidine kinase NtrY
MIRKLLKRQRIPVFTLLVMAAIALALALLLKNMISQDREDPLVYAEEIENKVNDKLEELDKTLIDVKQEIIDEQGVSFSALNITSKLPYYVYHNGKLVYWSDVNYVPEYHEITGFRPYDFKNLDAGQFVVSRKQFMLEDQEMELIGLLPVFRNSRINNRYIQYGFNSELFSSSKLTVKSNPQEGTLPIMAFGTYYLFSLDFGPAYQTKEPYAKYLVLLLMSVGILFLLIYGIQWITYLLHRKRTVWAFLFLVFYFGILRLLLLISSFPYGIVRLELFDSRYFASSALSPSLGDLLLNILYLLALIAFVYRNYCRSGIHGYILTLSGYPRLVFAAALVFLSHLVFSIQYQTLNSILFNSQLELDITSNVDLDIFKGVSLLIVFINALIFFLFSDVFIKIFLRINEYKRSQLALTYLLGSLFFGLYGWFNALPIGLIIPVNLLYLGIVTALKLPRNVKAFNFISFSYFFVSAFASAFIGAYAIYAYEKESMVNQKERFATQLIVEHDILGELLLAEASEKIRNDVFIQNRMFTPFLSKEMVKDRIKRVYLGNYFSKYDKQIYLYNTKGQSLRDYGDMSDFHELRRRLQKEEYQTEREDIFFVNRIGNALDKRYYCLIDVERYGYNINSGYIVIELKLKRNIPDNVYPELLVDRRYIQPFLEHQFDYAIFSNGNLIYNAGNFNYAKNFDAPAQKDNRFFEKGILIEGYHHLGVKGEENQLIVISSPLEPKQLIGSNFSYLFLVMVFFITLMLLSYASWYSFTDLNMNLTTKIQLYLNVAIFLPLLVVSITILSRVHAFHKRDLNSQYIEKAEQIRKNITGELDAYLHNELSREAFTSKLLELAGMMEIDVNVFNISGKLITSSQPMIYENKLLSKYINPKALALIREEKNNQSILDESIGNLDFKATYVSLRSFDDGRLMGILSIPFFESQDELDRKAVDVLSSIMTVFMGVFIGFFVLSYFATNMLTYPLKVLSQKLKRTSLSEYNEPLEWATEDEIGMVISEYNRMLLKLEKSKQALARTEKESAWREMAKQVAHEIKNPLTPMKLKLQHMKRMLVPSLPEDKREMTEKSINSLLTQVDTLSDIASSFSDFAKMPVPKREEFELSAMLRQVVGLHSSDAEPVIMDIEEGGFYVLGDSQFMVRAITNLILNAFQAIPADREPQVKVELKHKDNDKVLISVQDNGSGIEESIRERVFLPNFSTKFTGSGIGLAIVKRGIEHAGGRIWFETREGEGTTFYIELPLIMKMIE